MTSKMRRVYLAQYSGEIIYKDGTQDLWGAADPFLKDGKNVATV